MLLAGTLRAIFRALGLALVGAASGAAASGCGHPPPPTLPEWAQREPGHCQLARDLREGMEAMARRCAEQFVRHNGYTNAPPTPDTLRWIREVDDTAAWPDVFGARHGTLASRADAVQCSELECVVFFRMRGLGDTCTERVVVMTQVFTHLHLLPGMLRGRCRGQPA
jgi:hypothetical protein